MNGRRRKCLSDGWTDGKTEGRTDGRTEGKNTTTGNSPFEGKSRFYWLPRRGIFDTEAVYVSICLCLSLTLSFFPYIINISFLSTLSLSESSVHMSVYMCVYPCLRLSLSLSPSLTKGGSRQSEKKVWMIMMIDERYRSDVSKNSEKA